MGEYVTPAVVTDLENVAASHKAFLMGVDTRLSTHNPSDCTDSTHVTVQTPDGVTVHGVGGFSPEASHDSKRHGVVFLCTEHGGPPILAEGEVLWVGDQQFAHLFPQTYNSILATNIDS